MHRVIEPNKVNRKARILVADDDWMNREVLEAHLTGAGYDVAVVHSGEKALAAVQEQPPDLVLLDVRMQGMSGYDVCQQMKSEPMTRRVCVMMVTALNRDEDMQQAIEAGADDFISKPISSLVLLTRVRNLLRLKQSQDALMQSQDMLRQIIRDHADEALAARILADLDRRWGV